MPGKTEAIPFIFGSTMTQFWAISDRAQRKYSKCLFLIILFVWRFSAIGIYKNSLPPSSVNSTYIIIVL